MMMEVNLERLRAHRNNVGRYRRLLETRLSDLERAYIERRLREEQASIEGLLKDTFPGRLKARPPMASNFSLPRGASHQEMPYP
jgi:hypothetical protein